MRAAHSIAAGLLAVALTHASGCAESHVTEDGGFVLVDGALVACSVDGLARCDAVCGGSDVCLESAEPHDFCIAGLCVTREFLPDNRRNSCGGDTYCFDGRVCLLPPERTGSLCIEEAVCDDARAAGLNLPCVWSDGSRRVSGAPDDVDECPPSPHRSTPFCGAPCADCPPFAPNLRPVDSNELQPVCVGRSDTREVGICGLRFVGNCQRGVQAGADICMYGGISVFDLMDTACTCVVFRGADTADGLSDFGWPSSEEGCRAYRSMYPEEIECVVDRDWHTLP